MYNNMTLKELMSLEHRLSKEILNDKICSGIPLKSKPMELLRKVAIDWVDGKIFTNLDYGSNNMGFMTIMLGGLGGKYNVATIGLVYEYLDKAGHISVNGMPQFFSHRMLNRRDARKVLDMAKKYVKRKRELEESL